MADPARPLAELRMLQAAPAAAAPEDPRRAFLRLMSHQLRTPPATIKWYLGAVLAGDFGKLSDELKAALDRTRVARLVVSGMREPA